MSGEVECHPLPTGEALRSGVKLNRFEALPRVLVHRIAQYLPAEYASNAAELRSIFSSPFPYKKVVLRLSKNCCAAAETLQFLTLIRAEKAVLKEVKVYVNAALHCEVVSALWQHTSLVLLELSCRHLVLKDLLKVLGIASKKNDALRQLVFEKCILDEEEKVSFGDALGEFLKEEQGLKRLVVNDGINDDAVLALAQGLKANQSLECVELCNNNIRDKGGLALCEVLKANKRLRSLDLSYNEIGEEAALSLKEAMKQNTSLLELSLKNNRLGVRTGRALGEALKHNCTVSNLNLGYNRMGDECAVVFGEVLGVNRSLEELNLNGNAITAAGGQALGEGLIKNSTLKKLLLRLNSIHGEGKRALHTAKKRHKNLKSFDILKNQI